LNEDEWLHAASRNPAFDFLKGSAENIYVVNDGQPFNDKDAPAYFIKITVHEKTSGRFNEAD
jgi:hypothetical protein